MNNASPSYLETLSDTTWFVMITYAIAFLPWAQVQSTDFLSSEWKSIRTTRSAGRKNLAVSLVPSVWVLGYCVVQALVGDTKEMCAGIVALTFALIHALRSAWGLIQLEHFRIWAIKSIYSLQSMGVFFKLHNKDGTEDTRTDSIERTVERLYINNSLVDNQVRHGEAICRLRFTKPYVDADNTSHVLVDNDFDESKWKRRLRMLILTIKDAIAWIHSRRQLKLEPIHPEELWIDWVVALATQGLSHWIANMWVVEEREFAMNELDTAESGFRKRSELFAIQLLSFASLQIQNTDDNNQAKNIPDFTLWDIGEVDDAVLDGRICKQELFNLAVKHDAIFPFETRPGVILEEGYSKYKMELEKAFNNIPAHKKKFSPKRFSTDVLEWITIFLFLGSLARDLVSDKQAITDEKTNKQRDSDQSKEFRQGFLTFCNGAKLHKELCHPQSSMQRSDNASKHRKNTDQEVLDNAENWTISKSIAAANLREQLGLNQYWSEDGPRPVFPLSMAFLKCNANFNRNVLKVGEIIDVWSALNSGKSLTFLKSCKGPWDILCSESYDQEPSVLSGTRGNCCLKDVHGELEYRKFLGCIADPAYKHDGTEHSVTFMGYKMESVRTKLAHLILRNDEEMLNIKLGNREQISSLGVQFSLKLSETLLRRPEKQLKRTVVQMRLVWELQNEIEQLLYKRSENAETGIIALAALCILSFPSIAVTWSSCNVVVCSDESDMTALGSVFVSPVYGAQVMEMKVELIYMKHVNRVKANVWVINEVGEFRWQKWRDAFLGRLQGANKWKEKHGISIVEFTDTAKTDPVVDSVGNNYNVRKVWRGWSPFRPKFCRFEIEVSGLKRKWIETASPSFHAESWSQNLVTFRNSKMVHANYDDCDSDLLYHITNLVFKVDNNDVSGMDETIVNGDSLLKYSDTYLQDTVDLERAFALLETVAIRFSRIEAVQKVFTLLENNMLNLRIMRRAVKLLYNYVTNVLATVAVNPSQSVELVIDEAILPLCIQGVRMCANEIEVMKKLQMIFCVFLIHGFVNESINDDIIRGLFMINFYSGQRLQNWVIARCLKFMTRTFSIRLESTVAPGILNLSEEELNRLQKHIHHSFISSGLVHAKKVQKKLVQSGLLRSCTMQPDVQRTFANATVNAYINSLNNLALLMTSGALGIEKSPAQAVSLFKEAIANGDVSALYYLGNILSSGEDGVERDVARAVSLYEEAISKGHIAALHRLGNILSYGADDVTPDAVRAVFLYEEAISRGHVASFCNLGNILIYGAAGVVPDAVRALSLFEKAISSGHVDACNKLGTMLKNKFRGIEVDSAWAQSLFDLASHLTAD